MVHLHCFYTLPRAIVIKTDGREYKRTKLLNMVPKSKTESIGLLVLKFTARSPNKFACTVTSMWKCVATQ
jgi:hypothetical protein